MKRCNLSQRQNVAVNPCAIAALLLQCFIVSITLWLGLVTSALPAAEPTGKFLVLSDIHLNPLADAALYAQLLQNPSEKWPAILRSSKQTSLSEPGTDTNFALMESALIAAKKTLPKPDFILLPGDFLSHDWEGDFDKVAPKVRKEKPAEYQAFTAKTVAMIAAELRKHFPETPLFPTIGNEDAFCGDYEVTEGGAFLRAATRIWTPSLGPSVDAAEFRKTFAAGGYYSTLLPNLPQQRLIVVNSVFFSNEYEDVCGSSTQTPALDHLKWLDAALAEATRQREQVWLMMHVPPGIDGYDTVQALAKRNPPVEFWQSAITPEFLKILAKYPGTVNFALAGHTHMDDFRVLPIAGAKPVLCKLAPAVSPVFGNNPAFQVYEYDRASGTVRNYQTHYLTNISLANRPTPADGGIWEQEYDFAAAYPSLTFTAGGVLRLAEMLSTDERTAAKYRRYYAVDSPTTFAPASWPVYRCAIGNVTVDEFLKCAPAK